MITDYKKKIDLAIVELNIARMQSPNQYALSVLAQAIGHVNEARDEIARRTW